MNRLLKNSKSSQKNASPGLFSPALSHAPSWRLSSLSFTTRTLCLGLVSSPDPEGQGLRSLLTLLPDKACQPGRQRIFPKRVHNDCPIEGILVHLALSLCPSNPTLCHRSELAARTGSRVCPPGPLPTQGAGLVQEQTFYVFPSG